MILGRHALDQSPFSQAQCRALYAAIEVNDRIDADAVPPPAVPLDHPPDRLIAGFRLSRQLWREGFDRSALIGLVAKLQGIGASGGEDRVAFKHLRAKFKHLRFAFVLYAADHRCPPVFKAVTTAMGLLQDAVRHDRRGAAARHAALLRLLLSGPAHARLIRETDRLVPAGGADFRGFVLAEIARLRHLLASDTLTGHQFHAARKIVSRQVSFHDDMRTVHPAAEHPAMARYLATINGLMGEFHDDLVRRHVLGDLDYARAAFALPPAIRGRLDAVVALYPPPPGTSSSMPSRA